MFLRHWVILASMVGSLSFVFSTATAASTCEDVFVAENVSALTASKSIVARVLKHRTYQGLLRKQTPAGRAAKSTSISSSGGGGGSSASASTGTSGGRIRTIAAPVELPVLQNSYDLRGDRLRFGSVRWLSDTNFIFMNDSLAKYVGNGFAERETMAVEILDGLTGLVVPSSTTIGKFEETAKVLRLIDRGTGPTDTYRFVDPKTLKDIRPPIESAKPVVMADNFINYEDANGQGYLTSLYPQDFGLHETRTVTRELPLGFSKLASVNDNEGDSIHLISGPRFGDDFYYDSSRRAYLRQRRASSYEIETKTGEIYTVRPTLGNGLSLQKRGERGFQEVMFPGASHTKLITVFGDGPERTIVVEHKSAYETYYHLVKIGFQTSVVASDRDVFGRMERLGDRYILLAQKHGSWLATVPLLIDLSLGRVETLLYPGGQKAVVSVLDPKSYVEISFNGTSSTISLYDVAKKTLIAKSYQQGRVTLIPGTRILRQGTERAVHFLDVETGERLWSGTPQALPRVSPDGSRVAYLDGNTLRIAVLGKQIQSRRTF